MTFLLRSAEFFDISDRVSQRRCVEEERNAIPLLKEANSYLETGRAALALELYTLVLQYKSPGNPCAFLNRSLCYLLLNYPSLAAIDAYRALLVAEWQKNRPLTLLPFLQILTYSVHVTEQSYVGPKSEQNRLLRTDLASLNIRRQMPSRVPLVPEKYSGLQHNFDVNHRGRARNPTLADVQLNQPRWNSSSGNAATKSPLRRSSARGTNKTLRSLIDDVKMKAYYRLALALFKSGGGAMRSALDVLASAAEEDCVTVSRDVGEESDMSQLKGLELEIYEYLNEFLAKEAKSTNSRWDGIDDPQEKQSLAAILRSRHTMIPREAYPWDGFNMRNDTPRHEMEALAGALSSENKLLKVDIRYEDRMVPSTKLLANTDIPEGDVLLNDSTSFYVTSESSIHPKPYCDVCAAQMILEEAEENTPSGGRSEPSPSSDSGTTSSSDSSAFELSLNIEDWMTAFRPKSPISRRDSAHEPEKTKLSNTPMTPLSTEKGEPKSNEPPPTYVHNWRHCMECTSSYYCGDSCLVVGGDLNHAKICDPDAGAIDFIRRFTTDNPELPGAPPCPLRKMQAAMLFRIFTLFSDSSMNPLDAHWMKWKLDGKLSARRSMPKDEVVIYDEKPPHPKKLFPHLMLDSSTAATNDDQNNDSGTLPQNLIPWSYQQNVIFPILCLMDIDGLTLALDARRFDGWMLNTMMAKINTCMMSTKHLRRYKVYQGLQQVAKGVVAGGGEEAAKEEKSATAAAATALEGLGDTWVGSLHLVPSLIPVAGPGQTPNVHIVENGRRLTVIAGANSSPSQDHQVVSGHDNDNDNDNHDNDEDEDVEMKDASQTSSSTKKIAIRKGDMLLRSAEIVRIELRNDHDTMSFLDERVYCDDDNDNDDDDDDDDDEHNEDDEGEDEEELEGEDEDEDDYMDEYDDLLQHDEIEKYLASMEDFDDVEDLEDLDDMEDMIAIN